MVTIEVPREDSMHPGHIIYPLMGSKAVAVHDGHFTTGPFPNDGSPYDRGTYIVSVVISTLALSDNVKPILGETGQKLGGLNVKEGPLGSETDADSLIARWRLPEGHGPRVKLGKAVLERGCAPRL
jgi:hypothetical protein